MWVVVGLNTGVPWPTSEVRILFRGHEIILRPETDKLSPSIAVQYVSPMTYNETLLLVRHFLSSLAWIEGKPLFETMLTGGGHPINVGKGLDIRIINPHFRVDYLPDPTNSKARLALALYREALNVNSKPYQFLGFFKILNIVFKSGADQKAWINRTVDLIEDHHARECLATLKVGGCDPGDYLYTVGRCAIAHAFSDPLVDPDDQEDIERVSANLPLIKALAEHVIEGELGVKSQRTVWREHLYELHGFSAFLGSEIVSQLKKKQDVPPGSIPRFPRISIRLRDIAPFPACENLGVEVLDGTGGRVFLRCTSDDQRICAWLSLNFAEERLEFDPIEGVTLSDDGSSRAVRNAIDRIRFVKDLYGNGQLEVWDAERNVLLGQCDPFIPVNIDPGETARNLDRHIEQLEAEAIRRGLGPAERR